MEKMKCDSNKYVLVLTACISPVITNFYRLDPRVRIKDYQNSLKFWLLNPDERLNKILFIENSGYDLSSIRALIETYNIYNKEVEILQCDKNYIPEGFHYGYAELSMIDYALENSCLLKNSHYFIKVTGRLVFNDLSRLLDHLSYDYLFSVDFRNNTLFVKLPQRFVTTQLMIFNTSFYQGNFLNVKNELNKERRLIENLFYEKLIAYKNNNKCMLRWPINVDPTGHAGHWNKSYNSLKPMLINRIRSWCRVIFPRWWV